ncbi:hypothetical protein ACPOL_0104 [Acidisarcina polymorpha]|uniref:Uncharacterized protein n=1 Tax=Acidisarcina polymorpha TaxID=2211140 RepID=A0A2Z5FRZ1_9BACT|nr:hypothetical protein [Acidisarcina polymorpha]AXC09491.1 hypothetical protein ACPOL_0104 [Acidisarcina polymorpha]
MTFRARELSVDQKMVIEELSGRSLGDDEAISIRAVGSNAAPEWLRQSWESAEALGVDRLCMEEIDGEIDAARRARRSDVQFIAG